MKSVIGLLLLVATGCWGNAQTYSLDWHALDGGGGTSTGGVYSVSGTIGQPDAGAMSGGNYSLTGGFWSLLSLVQIPGSPLLTISFTSTNTAIVSWPSPLDWFHLAAEYQWNRNPELEQCDRIGSGQRHHQIPES